MTLQDLRCHVVGGPCYRLQLFVSLGPLGQPEVNQLDLAIVRKHDVLGFDIAMDDTLGVHVVACTQQLLQVLGCLLLRKNLIFLFGNLVEKLASADILHDKIYILLVYISFIILNDIRVIKLDEYIYLLLNALKVIFQLRFIHDFNGNQMVLVVLVKCTKNFAERTRS